jgi:hypothetical protein
LPDSIKVSGFVRFSYLIGFCTDSMLRLRPAPAGKNVSTGKKPDRRAAEPCGSPVQKQLTDNMSF